MSTQVGLTVRIRLLELTLTQLVVITSSVLRPQYLESVRARSTFVTSHSLC